jgi:hypothetical protein
MGLVLKRSTANSRITQNVQLVFLRTGTLGLKRLKNFPLSGVSHDV